jgi:PAS domain S-box-containing protein
MDAAGFILMVNKAWREFAEENQGVFALTCEGSNYLAVCDVASGEDSTGASEMAAAIRAVLAGEKTSYSLEYPCRSPDGERWFAVRLNPFPGDGPPRVVTVHEDITERKRVEAGLRESEARLRVLYENSLVGILFTAPDGRVFNANPAACRLLGRTEEEICRLGRQGLVDPQTPHLAELLAARARTGSVQCTLTYIRVDGTRFPADTSSVIFDTPEGPRTCTVIQDVSEREEAMERIRDFSSRLLTIREEEKQHLSAALHHDVGSMSVGVGARLQAVEEDLLAGRPQEAIAILRECRRLFDDSVQRLKALAMELRPPDLDLLGLPAALRQHFAQVTRIAPLQIRFSDATRGAHIEPQIETAVFRVVQECLNNVVKHAKARLVRIRLSRGKRGIRLSIADDGKGFNPRRADRVPGQGMGLRALQEIVRAHGGDLMIEYVHYFQLGEPDKWAFSL